MNNVLPLLLTVALAALGSIMLYRRGVSASPGSYAMLVHSVAAASPNDVAQQLIDLRRLVALNAITTDSAASHLADVWGVSKQEAKDILDREL